MTRRYPGGVLVEVGPVSSDSVLAFCTYARAVLTGFGRRGRPLELPEDVLTKFRGYLEEWERVAAQGETFKWATDLEVDEVEYLTHIYRGVAEETAETYRQLGKTLRPAKADEFYFALVKSLLDALTSVGGSSAAFAEELRRFWPGLDGEPFR